MLKLSTEKFVASGELEPPWFLVCSRRRDRAPCLLLPREHTSLAKIAPALSFASGWWDCPPGRCNASASCSNVLVVQVRNRFDRLF